MSSILPPGLDAEVNREQSTWPTLEAILARPDKLPRWMGWRLKALVIWVLLGCAILFGLANWLAGQPKLPMTLRGSPDGQVVVHAVDYPTLQALEGKILTGVAWPSREADTPGSEMTQSAAIDLLILQRSARWISDEEERLRYLSEHGELSLLLQDWQHNKSMSVTLTFSDGTRERVLITPRGVGGISPLFWILGALALMVFAVGAVVVLANPQIRNVVFALMTLCHAMQLALIAISTSLDVFTSSRFVLADWYLRTWGDLALALTTVAIATLHPRQNKHWAWWIGGAVMCFVLATVSLHVWIPSPWRWPAMQLFCIMAGLVALAITTHALRTQPHPFTLVMRRFIAIGLASWTLLSVAVATGGDRPDMHLNITTFAVMTWHVFAASQLLLSPYLSRSKLILQEFSLLAASSTVAASLDLLFVALFSLGQLPSMTLSLFLAFGLYLSLRRWLIAKLPGQESLSMAGMFQRLYRIAREVERRPDVLHERLQNLLKELFDPLEATLVNGSVGSVTIKGNGAVLLVPLPPERAAMHESQVVLVIKHAQKGQRLFTQDDGRLVDRIIEQLHRALHFDQAVEQGRSEERLRIAQDLHDDIGARLLTLMYQAPNPDIEDYIRHTLQDLKTLTRGLAAQSHDLTEAAGEWKRDLNQRLSVVRCELDWHMQVDTDPALTMVQWSALTRILRELVNNTISHAKANKVQVSLSLASDRLTLSVVDNGMGRAPDTWSHGLGLGGVRKRVKQLGGTVRWSEVEPKGIRCDVVVEPFSSSASPAADAQLSH